MPFWRLYYHLIWSTKERLPLIPSDVEPVLYGYIIGKAHFLGCIIHAIGGMENHIHIAASIPPKLSIADFVGHIKGSSAHHLNQVLVDQEFEFGWQRGYGVLSVSGRQLDDVVAYVKNQKTHHREGSLIAGLEHDSREEDSPTAWRNGEAIADIKIAMDGSIKEA